jgi:malate dehydrogenase (oxaloacetate-decarboxylating)(NADP+)
MKSNRKRQEALIYHAKPRPGKIEVVPTKKYSSQRDLSLAYSPGVAEPCLEIAKNKSDVYKYTAKGNLVAVITNGTAVLGLGDIGPEASKPVMEGKGLLFKIFADIDCFDIEVDTKDIDAFVETVKNISPTFGGINLEDIKAPDAFEIERRLKEELDIPVMHDDQHGTAIISTAALKNALEIAGKDIDKVKIVVSGAGSAAMACVKLYVELGAKKENIHMFDIDGLISKKRTNLYPIQLDFASQEEYKNLAEGMIGADVFLGLSVGNIVTPEMLLSMNETPIVFAMANPVSEIDYNLAIKTRKDIIMATGRSDFPNQVNNVLGFPYIFRGALDVRATKINEEMKMAAVHALANLAKEPVPEQVNIAYNKTYLSFGKDYILPKPFDNRLISVVPPAVAKAAMDSGVALEPILNWEKYIDSLEDRLGKGNKIIRLLHNRAKANPKKVVFAEADHLDVLKAAQVVYDEEIAIPILLGNKEKIKELREELGFDAEEIEVIDPKSPEEEERKTRYANLYWELRQRKGVTKYSAEIQMRERNYFAAMMIKTGEADAFISGYSRKYSSVLAPLLEILDREKGVHKISSTNLMLTKRGPMFFSDTAITPNPDAKDLALTAEMTSIVIKMFGITPNIAMLSYSNFGSANNHSSRKIKEAIELLHESCPDLNIDGELQADFALNPEMLKKNFPFSKLVGKQVNALIFPNLDSANINYKLLKELNGTDSIGPIIMGLSQPAHILQLGASVDEIVNMTAIAVVDAQQKAKKTETKS